MKHSEKFKEFRHEEKPTECYIRRTAGGIILDFGKKVEWVCFNKAQLGTFIRDLEKMHKELK